MLYEWRLELAMEDSHGSVVFVDENAATAIVVDEEEKEMKGEGRFVGFG